MVCNKSEKPEGLGRAVLDEYDDKWVLEGLFKQGAK